MVWPLRWALAKGVLINTTWNPLSSFLLFPWCPWPFWDCQYQMKPPFKVQVWWADCMILFGQEKAREEKQRLEFCFLQCQNLMCCLWISSDRNQMEFITCICLFIYFCIFVVGGGQMTQQKLVCTGFSQHFHDSSNISGLLENSFLKLHKNHRASSERMSD